MKSVWTLLNVFLVAVCLLFPGHAVSGEDWYEQGLSLLKSHQYEAAIKAFSRAIGLNLNPADAYNNRGFAWHEKGDYQRAIADYTKALDVNPRHAEAYNNLAWALAVCPDPAHRNGAKALELAQKAVKLTAKAYALDTLAAAYAELGRFKEAVAVQRKVIALDSKEAKTEELTEYRERLKSYRTEKPWREKHITLEGRPRTISEVVILQVPIGRVREGPSLDSKIKFRLKRGQTVSIIEKKGDWYLVAQRTGWAHQSLFSDKDSAEEPIMAMMEEEEGFQSYAGSLKPSSEGVNWTTLQVPIGRVREGPSLDSKIKFRLKRGQTVSIIEKKGDWYVVELLDGRTGWAHQSLFIKSY
jgi:tetratricopeptide (TPR) repeat protein